MQPQRQEVAGSNPVAPTVLGQFVLEREYDLYELRSSVVTAKCVTRMRQHVHSRISFLIHGAP
jgi:hypothetical protein